MATRLAPYAGRADASRGRVHAEPSLAPCDPFQIDRTRVLSSTAFRRLQYKTQVFVYDEHDHFRTRLTHTLEVADVARRLAASLNVNADLAEVIALAHDLGHPPFGHAGEATLRARMTDAGGFEHNVQSLRIVEFLDHPFPQFRGLNLAYEVREGLIKHVTKYDVPDARAAGVNTVAALMQSGPWPTVEGQIVCIADRIAYNCHDLEDALGAGLIDEPALDGLRLWHRAAAPIRAEFPDRSVLAVRRPILAAMRDEILADVVRHTSERIRSRTPADVDQVRNAPAAVVAQSPDGAARMDEIEAFLAQRVYRHPKVVQMDGEAKRVVDKLFKAYSGDPTLMPPRFASRVAEQGKERVVCDYIAGMTDRYCRYEHQRVCC